MIFDSKSVSSFSCVLGAILLFGPASAGAQEFQSSTLLSADADTAPAIATDGAGTWVVVAESDDNIGGTSGTDDEIAFMRSTDDGATWSAAAVVNSNASTDSGTDFQPSVATDGAGHWVVAWVSNDTLGGTIGTDYDLLLSRSSNNGATWTPPLALNTNAAFDSDQDYRPNVATDGDGNWVVAWQSYENLGGTIGGEGDILVARSSNNGATWTAPATLNTNASTDSGYDAVPHVIPDGAGTWIAVWTSEDSLGGTIGTDQDILVARSTNNGATWSAPSALNSDASADSGFDAFARLATDGAGNWVCVWYSDNSPGTDHDIRVSRSSDGGMTWTAASNLNSTAASDGSSDHDSNPMVATDGAGNWIAAWMSTNSLGGTIGTDLDILASRSNDDGATWSTTSPLDPAAASDARGDRYAEIATDSAGNWVAVWESDFTDILVSSGSICGDDAVARLEACDDGGVADGDCCSSDCEFENEGDPCTGDGDVCTQDFCDAAGTCGIAEPLDDSSCMLAPATKLQISNSSSPGRDKLSWRWGKGDAFGLLDLGTPAISTGYALCLYDMSGSVPSLAARFAVAPSESLWTSREEKGFDYKDRDGTSAGVTKLQLRTGEMGRSSVKLSAKGTALVLPAPVGATYFEQSPSVVAQLRNSDGECWTSSFVAADTAKNLPTAFKAQTK